MTLSTRFFEGLALTTAKGRGMPALKQVILPFPYETLTEEQVRAHARRALDAVVKALTEAEAANLTRL
ncbi:MAG: hypothetical protein HY686_07560 [Chloroflexi bacterium]|nr:hypothetical protein [Chloroflexota bacterium]